MIQYDDEFEDNGWDADFLSTQAEYDGILPEVECDYCSRGLIVGERRYKTEFGRVCVDCRDIIREGDV